MILLVAIWAAGRDWHWLIELEGQNKITGTSRILPINSWRL